VADRDGPSRQSQLSNSVASGASPFSLIGR
jgi:hypothetical protein